jgi:hypothetical protein
MMRIFLMTCLLALAPMLAHSQDAGPAKQASPAAAPQMPSNPISQPVPLDSAVITVHGLCPPSKGGAPENPDSCATVITRRQFEAMLAVMNITNQAYSPAALRSLAESYVQLMALADAGQKAGIDKDPRFDEMLKVMRVRALAELYRRSLDEKFNDPPRDVVEAYYKDNADKYQQLKVDRVLIPLADPRRPQERAAFEKKARQLAADARERAAKGEDMNALQVEAYKVLGLPSPPPADLGAKRKGNFPPAVEKDIFALKPGEVTKVETDLAGFSFYKVRSREPIPLEYVKAEITRELYQKSMEGAMKSATSRVHSDYNDQFFKPQSRGPVPPVFRPAPHVTVEGVGAAGSPAGSAQPGGSAPAANPGNPPAQTSTLPK